MLINFQGEQDLLRKTYPHDCFAMTQYVLITVDCTGVSTFLCTQKLRPEEVSVTAVYVHMVLLQCSN